MNAKAPVVEIIEHGKSVDGTKRGDDVIMPDDVRINGQSILCDAGEPVVVHEIDLTNRSVVRVTLTLIARRVIIGAEDD